MYGNGHRFGLGEQAAPDDANGYVEPLQRLGLTDMIPTVIDTEVYADPQPVVLAPETVTAQSVPQMLPTLTVTTPPAPGALSPLTIAAIVVGIYLYSRSRR